jgi:predicted nucleotidyltransferase
VATIATLAQMAQHCHTAPMTPDQQSLLDRITQQFETDSRIEALWLAGSFATGKGDAFSDVDVLALCAAGTLGAVSADSVKNIGLIAPPLLVLPLFGGRVISVVVEGWQRFDISLIEAEELSRYDPAWLSPLFNRTGVQPPGHYPESYTPAPETLLRLTNEFLRILGLAVTVAGRADYVVLMSGVEQLRGLTLELMLEENRIGPWARGGHLSRRPLLTQAQYATLSALPPLSADQASTVANHVALAGIFLPLAKRLCSDAGAQWPVEFEDATWAHLHARLGLDPPSP